MKKILALLLLLASFALLLTGCAYNYAKNASKYATVNKTVFDAALSALPVSVPDLIDEADVLDDIYTTLAGKAGSEKKTEGVALVPDKVSYCYYAVTAEGNKLFTSKMAVNPSDELQLGRADNAELAKKIEMALADFDFSGVAYVANSSGRRTSDIVVISYKMEVKELIPQEGDEDPIETTKTISVSKDVVDLSVAVNNADLAELYAEFKKESTQLNTSVKNEDSGVEGTFTATSGTVFKDAKIDFEIQTGEKLAVTHTPYTTAYTAKDEQGNDVQLQDVELTYYIYPAYYIDVEELSADAILTVIVDPELNGADISADYGDLALTYAKALAAQKKAQAAYDSAVTELTNAEADLAAAQQAQSEKEEALTAAQTAYDEAHAEASPASEEEKDEKTAALNAAKADKDAADEAVVTAQAAVEEKTAAKNTANEALTAANESEDLSAADVETKANVVDTYKKKVRDILQAEQNDSLKKSVYTAIYNEIKKVEVKDELPASAVKNEYEAMLNLYKATFYSPSSTSDDDTSVSLYKQYSGNFDKYLIAVTGTSTLQEAKDKINADAKDRVQLLLRIYAVAEAYECKITNAEFKKAFDKVTDNSYMSKTVYSEQRFTETAARTALLFDKLMGILSENTTAEDGIISWTKVGFKAENE